MTHAGEQSFIATWDQPGPHIVELTLRPPPSEYRALGISGRFGREAGLWSYMLTGYRRPLERLTEPFPFSPHPYLGEPDRTVFDPIAQHVAFAVNDVPSGYHRHLSGDPRLHVLKRDLFVTPTALNVGEPGRSVL